MFVETGQAETGEDMAASEESAVHGRICILGAGPAGLGLALGIARRGFSGGVVVYDQAEDHETAPRYNPDRSYTIDITGHGARALDYLGVVHRFDEQLIKFRGIRILPLGKEEPWTGPGWTGSRGDICRALMRECREKYPGKVKFVFGTTAEVQDAYTGTVVLKDGSGGVLEKSFDLIVACDGAGSTARTKVMADVPGFKSEKTSLTNFCTMVHFDQNTEELDPSWLYVLNIDPPAVAGAINGDGGPRDPKWFCQIGFRCKNEFKDVPDAIRYIKKTAPKVLRHVSDKELAAFAKRECVHIGRAVVCNTFNAGRLVLLGDAGNPFPPVGQGINAALESAMVLDQCLATADSQGRDFAWAGAKFTETWLPEAHAVSWIAQRVESGNLWKMGLVVLAVLLRISLLSDAKKDNLKWSVVADAAKARQAMGFRVARRLAQAAVLGLTFFAGYKIGKKRLEG